LPRPNREGEPASRRHRPLPHRRQRPDQLINLRRIEQAFRSAWREIRERGFVEPVGGDDAVRRQVIDDEVDELDLVRR
jgi:hypothetical protein